MKTLLRLGVPVSIGIMLALSPASGQVEICNGASGPACQAVRGDRSEGWLPQTRSEVMARNGMVTTVQPLAAQAACAFSSRAETRSTLRWRLPRR